MKKVFSSVFFIFFFPRLLVFSQPEPGKDYKNITRMYGSRLINYEEKIYEQYLFITGETMIKTIGGKFYQICYKMPARDWKEEEVMTKYQRDLPAAGYKIIFSNDIKLTITAFGNLDGKLCYVEMKVFPDCGDYMLTVIEKGDPPPPSEEESEADRMARELEAMGHLLVYGITFDLNSAKLRLSSSVVLDRIFLMLNKYTSLNLEIQGHTDNTGSADYNLKLSRERAKSVYDYLIAKGIFPERLTTVGHGDARPVAENSSEEGRAKNRRVELLKK